ncbi:vWA domain-containing protein [Haloplanus natans]|uniref:vWA domain-containing protein n=1 Tax=Haloplanus natans TaxID=376171 RepID=UPI000677B258|nr:vWA domain-containing protein [Haloplanus natans]
MQDDFNLSRRKALAALGTIGVASAGAGLGTSAYFSDQETFENNRLVAGELDLKMDWEEHYSDWSADEDDPGVPEGDALDITMDEPADPTQYTAFPPGVEAFDGEPGDDFVNGDPLLYVNNDDVGQFMDNTSVEAFPDSDDDGVQDEFDATNACTILADVGNDDGGLDSDLRTESSRGDPLIGLDDVKPGDFGELTLSFHLCDNPGYVWLNAANVSAAENGLTEPEADDPDETGPTDETSTSVQNEVELLDEIQTALWYDTDCNNLTGGRGGATGSAADVALVLDDSGSIGSSERNDIISAAKVFIDELSTTDQAATVAFGSSAEVEQQLTQLDTQGNVDAVKDAIDTYGSSGVGSNTNIDAALDAANGELESSRARQSATPVIVLLSDGSPSANDGVEGTDDALDNDFEAAVEEADDVKSSGKRIITIGFGLDAGGDGENLLRAVAGTTANSESDYTDYESGSGDEPDDEGDYFAAPEPEDLQGQFEDIAGVITTGEEIFFQGSLRNALAALTDGNGIPLDGDAGDDFDELGSDPTASGRACFPQTPATNCLGFSWWLPADHGNEIQGDSVAFDLGFYTEQCRHNDGSGMNNEAVGNPDELDA